MKLFRKTLLLLCAMLLLSTRFVAAERRQFQGRRQLDARYGGRSTSRFLCAAALPGGYDSSKQQQHLAHKHSAPKRTQPLQRLTSFVNKNFFLLGLLTVVTSSKLAPGFGATGGPLRPEITIGKAAIACIFFLTGFRTELRDLGNAAQNHRLNAFTQGYNLVALPPLGWAAAKALRAVKLSPALADGVTALFCLPTTISMCVVLSQAAGGAVAGAGAAFNAVAGNLLGLAVTPALVLLLLPKAIPGEVQLVKQLIKLASQVVAPLAAGSALRLWPAAAAWQKKYKQPLSRFSEAVLLAIVYNVFCDALVPGVGGTSGALAAVLSPQDAIILPAALVTLHVATLAAAYVLGKAAGLLPQELPVAMFAGSHKTLSFGIPLLGAMFGGGKDPALLAAMTAPLLMYHPIELLLGSALVPRIRRSLAAQGVEL